MEEIEQILNSMLNAAFNQGMAMQRINDAQSEFDSHIEAVGTGLIKLREILNTGEDKQEIQ